MDTERHGARGHGPGEWKEGFALPLPNKHRCCDTGHLALVAAVHSNSNTVAPTYAVRDESKPSHVCSHLP